MTRNLITYKTMKKKIVFICNKIFWKLPWGGGGRTWKYYKEILNIYVSPARGMCETPKWCKPWMWNAEHYLADILFDFLKKNKEITRECHRAVIKKKNEKSTDGTYYV